MEAKLRISRSGHPNLGYLEAVCASDYAYLARGRRFLQNPTPATGRQQIARVAKTRANQLTLVQRDQKMFSPAQLKLLPASHMGRTWNFPYVGSHPRLLVACIEKSCHVGVRKVGMTGGFIWIPKEFDCSKNYHNNENYCPRGSGLPPETGRTDESLVNFAPRAGVFQGYRFATMVASHLIHDDVHNRTCPS